MHYCTSTVRIPTGSTYCTGAVVVLYLRRNYEYLYRYYT